MRIQASAGRNAFLSDAYATSLTIKADHPDVLSKELECEFLGRLMNELKLGNIGYWLGQLRKAQKPKSGRAKK